ncbi:DMT family transporter [Mobilicoccus massiliensis]|uniref:DMT family transporter n=1 Tax=Mobilicoccus massiliensis TaxID=1522310 RepID=UPI00069398D4|nr:DMT family transporter [Mobilicoccus massiliensis]
MSPRLRGNALLLLTAAIWGLAFVAQRVGADHMGAFAFNAARFTLGALSLLPVIALFDRLRARRVRAGTAEPESGWARTRSALAPGVSAGTILFIASSLQQYALHWTTAGKAGFITGLYIVLVPILGLFLRHRTTVLTWLGAALAVGGLYVLSVRSGFTLAPGDGFVLVSALFWATHILVVDRFTSLDALRFSAIQFTTTALLSFVGAGLFEENAFAGLDDALAPVFYGGVLSVGVAYTLQVFGQRDARPAAAAIILSLEAVFAAIGGILLLGEPLTWREATGFTLMLAGILVSQWPTKDQAEAAHGGPAGAVPEAAAEDLG